VILQRRREPDTISSETAPSIADAALKILDVAPAARRTARRDGIRLLELLGRTELR